ncbi:hypothetical protein [uncultured Methanolobus sp.]|uniref:hypothetical protein n=1 Tax=uncultured Methanolobus sp. TaxID=218300 RepID=UPI002AAAFEC8|nr:hypothetical protein [uncultured Methanolobus sp.]
MKKMPLAVLIFLMLLVVISGMADSDDAQQYSGDRPDDHRVHSSPPIGMDSSSGGIIVVAHTISFSSSVDEESFLGDNIKKSESMVQRLENATEKLEEKGNNVSDLKGMIINYGTIVSESGFYLEMANNASSEAEMQKYLELSRESIILANSELKPILYEIKQYLPGPIMLENNTLGAEGSGVAIFSGDTNLSFFLSEGKFSVVDFNGDIVIDINADYKQDLSPDRESADLIMPHSMASYVEVTGNVSMSGSGYTIAIMADRMSLTVTGSGEAELIGNGTYHINDGLSENKENVWMTPIFESD